MIAIAEARDARRQIPGSAGARARGRRRASDRVDGAEARGRSFEVAAAPVPVGQHPALAIASATRGARGVPGRCVWPWIMRSQPRLGERALHRRGRDVHDVHRLALPWRLRCRRAVPCAMATRSAMRARERGALPRGIAHLRAERLVLRVVGAERVAVQERACARP